MEKRSHRRIRDLVAHAAFQGIDANEIGCARMFMMARSNTLRSRGRILISGTSHLQITTSACNTRPVHTEVPMNETAAAVGRNARGDGFDRMDGG
jgi:hypothetical protein